MASEKRGFGRPLLEVFPLPHLDAEPAALVRQYNSALLFSTTFANFFFSYVFQSSFTQVGL